MKIKNIIILILVLLGIIGSVGLYEYIRPDKNAINSNEFVQKTDSLNKLIDSLNKDINKSDSVIEQLTKNDSLLSSKVDYYKLERDIAKAKAKELASKIKTLNNDELINFFVERYAPESPLTLAVPKEALVLAAHDITMCDGVKKELILADSTISILNIKLDTKDSIIDQHEIQKSKYQDIVLNQDYKYELLKDESDSKVKELKGKLLWNRITSGVVIGSLALIIIL